MSEEAEDISRRLEAEGYKALEYTEVDELRDTVECLRATIERLTKERDAARRQRDIATERMVAACDSLATEDARAAFPAKPEPQP